MTSLLIEYLSKHFKQFGRCDVHTKDYYIYNANNTYTVMVSKSYYNFVIYICISLLIFVRTIYESLCNIYRPGVIQSLNISLNISWSDIWFFSIVSCGVCRQSVVSCNRNTEPPGRHEASPSESRRHESRVRQIVMCLDNSTSSILFWPCIEVAANGLFYFFADFPFQFTNSIVKFVEVFVERDDPFLYQIKWDNRLQNTRIEATLIMSLYQLEMLRNQFY